MSVVSLQVSKFLDTAGSKLDYRRYGEPLLDVLIAGGILGELLNMELINSPVHSNSNSSLVITKYIFQITVFRLFHVKTNLCIYSSL